MKNGGGKMKRFHLFLLVIFCCLMSSAFCVENFTDEFDLAGGKKITDNWRVINSWDGSTLDGLINSNKQLEMIHTSLGEKWSTSAIERTIGTGDFEIVLDIANIEFYKGIGEQNVILEVWDKRPDQWDAPEHFGIMFIISHDAGRVAEERNRLSMLYRNNTEALLLYQVFFEQFQFPMKLKLVWSEEIQNFTGYYGIAGEDATTFLSATSDYSSKALNYRKMVISIQHSEVVKKPTKVVLERAEIVGNIVSPYQENAENKPVDAATSSTATAPVNPAIPTTPKQNTWYKDYQIGMDALKANKTPGIIIFTMPSIKTSEDLRKILDGEKLTNLLSNLALIEVDASTQKDLLANYGIFKIPTLLILDSNGNKFNKWIPNKEDINEAKIYNYLIGSGLK